MQKRKPSSSSKQEKKSRDRDDRDSPAAAPVQEAPTFEAARAELHAVLSKWVFARVVKPCVVPADARERDPVTGAESITYFHGGAVQLDTGNGAPGAGERIWFKKAPAVPPPGARRRTRGGAGTGDDEFTIGPVRVKPARPDYIPQVGDVLMGKVQTSASSSSVPGRGPKFLFWYPDAYRLFVLARLVCLGTALTEADLGVELRAGGGAGAGAGARWATFRRCGGGAAAAAAGGDDVWALARLVLFGNVLAFAKQHDASVANATTTTTTTPPPMDLSVPPLDFIYTCTLHFDDVTIWEHFKTLVPGAELPPFEEENAGDDDDAPLPKRVKAFAPPPRLPVPVPAPAAAYYYDDGGDDAPASPPYRPNTPPPPSTTYEPASPPYCPNTPPADAPDEYDPERPAYEPASPPYTPTTPPSADALAAAPDEYDPERPAYTPTPPPPLSVDSIMAILQRVAALEQ